MTEAYAVVERWTQTFNEGDADATATLYAPGATIWGTLAQSLTTSPDEIKPTSSRPPARDSGLNSENMSRH
jgi:hypothetical protein